MVGVAAKEALASEHGVLAAQRDQPLRELEQRLLVDVEVPVDPGDGAVLAVGVVVAVLGAAELVAVQQHRDALAQHQDRQEVLLLPQPQRPDHHVVGRPLDTAVPASVVALAVVAAFAVGLVVLLVVADEIAQGEAVVGGDEVDGRDGFAAGVFVQVGRACEPAGELGQSLVGAAHEVADSVAVLAVPFGPQGREAAHLVAAHAEIPRLRDQLHLRQHRVLADDREERRQRVHLVQFAGQRRREVEPESVDVHLRDPVAQRIHDELQRERAAHVQRVARAGGVEVVELVALDEPVVLGVVDAPEAQRRAQVVALCGVVVDHVEDHLDVGAVQVLHHRLEFLHLVAALTPVGVLVVRREEPDRVVAPVVAQTALGEVVVLNELVHRHQLDGVHAQRRQVRDHRRMADSRIAAPQRLGDVGVQLGEALDVRLVDHQLVVLVQRRVVVTPVEVGRHDHRVHGVAQRVVGVALRRIGQVVAEQRRVVGRHALDRLGVGVEQQLRRVTPVAAGRIERSVDPVAVALARLNGRQVGVPGVGVDLGELDLRLVEVVVEQAEHHLVGDLGVEREIGSGPVERCAKWVAVSRPDLHESQPSAVVGSSTDRVATPFRIVARRRVRRANPDLD